MAKKSISSYEQIISDLQAKRYNPIYFLMGEESFFIDKIVEHLEHKVLDEAEVDFNLTILYGRDVLIADVINAAKRYPMMSEYQVVIVKEAQHIKNWDDLFFYIEKPLKSTILCFSYKHGTPDGRKNWVKAIYDKAVVLESKKLYEYQIGAWITDYLKQKNTQITAKALAMLVDFLGTNLSKISNELDKLLIIKDANEKFITPELIEKNIGISKDYNTFELLKALSNRDAVKANRIINYFGQNSKEFPIVLILPSMFFFFSNLMLYHYLPDKNQYSVAGKLGVPAFAVKEYEQAAKVFNAWKTMNIVSWLRETDARSKGVDDTGTNTADLLKELVYKILH